MFESAELDARETRTPMNTDTPANAGESDAGRYGNATTTPKAMRSTLTILFVGAAHSAGKFANTMRPCAICSKSNPHESNRRSRRSRR